MCVLLNHPRYWTTGAASKWRLPSTIQRKAAFCWRSRHISAIQNTGSLHATMASARNGRFVGACNAMVLAFVCGSSSRPTNQAASKASVHRRRPSNFTARPRGSDAAEAAGSRSCTPHAVSTGPSEWSAIASYTAPPESSGRTRSSNSRAESGTGRRAGTVDAAIVSSQRSRSPLQPAQPVPGNHSMPTIPGNCGRPVT